MATKRQVRMEQKKVVPSEQRMETGNASSAAGGSYLPYWIILFFTMAIYANTLWNKYAIDDTMVITENKFTLQGFQGIKDIMTHDAFVGLFGEKGSALVTGGRYRPLSIVTLAVEVEFFGQNPAISHAINVLLFALTCVLLYHLLKLLFPPKSGTPFYLSLPFLTAVLYAAHPIHTEVVANIKGRDELMGMLFSLVAMLAAVQLVRTGKWWHLVYGVPVYFLGLLSKENAITFMAIIPLTMYFFLRPKSWQYVAVVLSYIVPVIVFMYMRHIFTNAATSGDSTEILNNPFAYTSSFIDRYPAIFYTFLLYLKLLLFPHPLTQDYYFNQIPIIPFSDFRFILSALLHLGILVYVVVNFRKRTIPVYAICFYFITFSIVSNLVFTVGALMNERFVYLSSVGFALLSGWILLQAASRFRWSANVIMGITATVLLLYSAKTIARNFDWVDNMTLFIVDGKVSENSAKGQTSLGGDLTKLADENYEKAKASGNLQRYCDLLEMGIQVKNLPDSIVKQRLLSLAIVHLRKALSIYPTHSNTWLLLGNAEYKLNHNSEEAIADYQYAAKYRVGGYYDAWYNMGCVYLERNQPELAKVNFQKALSIKPDEFPCRYNLADAYSKTGQPDSAIYWYNKTLELKANDPACYYKIGTIYGKQMNNLAAAVVHIEKAIEFNPEVPLYYEDLGVAYGLMKEYAKAINASERCLKKFPDYAPAYFNLAISYRNLGDMAKANQYEQRAIQLRK
ncbi:MAG: tetratricopeptide repeat protein [Chitinophagales bacterium]